MEPYILVPGTCDINQTCRFLLNIVNRDLLSHQQYKKQNKIQNTKFIVSITNLSQRYHVIILTRNNYRYLLIPFKIIHITYLIAFLSISFLLLLFVRFFHRLTNLQTINMLQSTLLHHHNILFTDHIYIYKYPLRLYVYLYLYLYLYIANFKI